MLQDGFYTGECCVLRVQRIHRGPLAGKAYLILHQIWALNHPEIVPGQKGFAFMEPDNSVQFFVAFAARNTPEMLENLRKIVAEIVKRHTDELGEPRLV